MRQRITTTINRWVNRGDYWALRFMEAPGVPLVMVGTSIYGIGGMINDGLQHLIGTDPNAEINELRRKLKENEEQLKNQNESIQTLKKENDRQNQEIEELKKVYEKIKETETNDSEDELKFNNEREEESTMENGNDGLGKFINKIKSKFFSTSKPESNSILSQKKKDPLTFEEEKEKEQTRRDISNQGKPDPKSQAEMIRELDNTFPSTPSNLPRAQVGKRSVSSPARGRTKAFNQQKPE